LRKSKDIQNTETAIKKLNALYDKLNVEKPAPKKDRDSLFDDEDTITILPDISEYPFIVNPTTDNFLTVYSSPEKESWMIDIAVQFNKLLPIFPKLFVILPFFSNSSFLIFNILDVFAAPFQKSLSGLNSCFLQSAIHCPNVTTVVYLAFHHSVKYSVISI
jgi:hypothetical protein